MEDFVYEVIVDICARTFKLKSSDGDNKIIACEDSCLLYTSPSPRDLAVSRMPSSA